MGSYFLKGPQQHKNQCGTASPHDPDRLTRITDAKKHLYEAMGMTISRNEEWVQIAELAKTIRSTSRLPGRSVSRSLLWDEGHNIK